MSGQRELKKLYHPNEVQKSAFANNTAEDGSFEEDESFLMSEINGNKNMQSISAMIK